MMKKISNKQLWIEEKNQQYRIGLTNQGQNDFGNVTFVMFPKVGQVIETGDTITELEAEKAVTELLSPVAGVIKEVNQAALNDSSILDNPMESEAWLVTLEQVSPEEFQAL